ncbi:MAG: glycosyltransferase family 2 protein [Bacteroidales bacterium]|nr:glycosyltransferase family 2 protein [Bacteroidales bacterium]
MKIFIPTALWGTSPLKKGGVKELISNKKSDSTGINTTSSKFRGGVENNNKIILVEKTPEISIIVPVYNSAETIKECVNSIVAQDFTNWELLLVDDGSSDSSHGICLELAAQDKRMVALQQEHKGVSAARNLALDKAKGTYICFVDADDTVETDYLSSLYEHHDYDMVICGYFVDEYNEKGELKSQKQYLPSPQKLQIMENKEELLPLFTNGMININCNKLLNTQIIKDNNIRYSRYPINEDYIFMIQYLMQSKSICAIEKPLYHWIRVENHITGINSIPENMLNIFNEAHLLTRNFFKNNDFADVVLYYSYQFIVLKYLNCLAKGNMTKQIALAKLKALNQNVLVRASYAAYKPKSLGDRIMHTLQDAGWYRCYYYLLNKLRQTN